MDGLTFIANVVGSVAWPLVVAAGVCLFRDPLSLLIPQMQRLKFKDLEADFQSLSVSAQSLLFLDGVARKYQWTFYSTTRVGERALGQAFALLVADLLKVEKNELLVKLESWLGSGDNNCIWFASEVIGYFEIKELADALPAHIPTDMHQPWLPHQLNCLWAHARCTKFHRLRDSLLQTKDEHNQLWLIFAYGQMPVEHQVTRAECLTTLRKFLDRTDISETAREAARKAVSDFGQA